jgi:DNA-binding CsgD family transcriptional regulator
MEFLSIVTVAASQDVHEALSDGKVREAAGDGKLRQAPGDGKLSVRERELVTLVAQGGTNAQIAAQLHISVYTVRSHLDRIREKTGCRRRADLTRLALHQGLV